MSTGRWRWIIVFMAVGWAWAASTPLVQGQGVATSAILTAPRLILISGEQMQLEARARDSAGNARPSDTFTFTSASPLVASVDASGVVRAVGVGVTNLTARTGNVTTPAVLLQVIPSRIDITADRQEIIVGETLQMTATVRDIYGSPIPGVTLAWQTTGANGGDIRRAATIDANGLVSGLGMGVITIRAQVDYPNRSSAHLPQFGGLTYISIRPLHEYKLTRLLTNSAIESSIRLRPAYNSEFAVNDRGQVAFTANLDGLTSSLLLYENGSFTSLASTATPGILGAYTWHFEGPPAINNRGEALVRIGTRNGWGLMLASKTGTSFLVENGTEGAFQSMGAFRAGRHSLNDRGDIAFLADFSLPDSAARFTGLFTLKEGTIQAIWTTLDSLPAFPSPFSFDNSMFGIDASGAAFFRVTSGTNSAVYRTDGISAPLKIAGTGMSTPSGTIQDVQNLTLSSGGVAAFGFKFLDGTFGAGRWRPGSLTALPLRSLGQVLSVNDSGQVLYIGDPGTGWSVHTWGSQSDPLLDWSAPLEGGERPTWVRTGKITPSGEAFLSMDSLENNLLAVRASSTTRTLWKGGMVVNLQGNLNFIGPLSGATTGPVHVFAGGGNASIMEVTAPDRVQPVWIPGDRPAQGLTGYTMNYAAKSPNGTLYVAISDGILRYSAGRVEAVLRYPIEFRNEQVPVFIRGNANWYDGSNAFAASDSSAFVFNARTDTSNRLMLYIESQLKPIMIQGGANQTASPSGGLFTGIAGGFQRQSTVAIDSRGRVAVIANVSGGRSGLFRYDNGSWQALALIGQTQIDGSTLSAIRTVRSDGEYFYALMDFANGGFAITKFDGVSWSPLVRRFDIMPDGTELTALVNGFATNHRGDIAFGAYSNIQKIIVRTADGRNHIVYTEMSVTPSGDRLISQTYELDLRDDGRLYFAGVSSLDTNTVYLAEPEF